MGSFSLGSFVVVDAVASSVSMAVLKTNHKSGNYKIHYWIEVYMLKVIQSNFIGSNTFGTMKICSRKGCF